MEKEAAGLAEERRKERVEVLLKRERGQLRAGHSRLPPFQFKN